MKTKLEIAKENLEKAYKRCEYLERFIGCSFYKRKIASAQGWLVRRRKQLAELEKE